MGKRQLVIAVKEAEYIERLAEYIRHTSFGESWQLTAFTNAAAFRSFVRAGYPVDLVAAQPAMLDELQGAGSGIPQAALVMQHGDAGGDRQEILQYQPLPQLLQALAAVCAAAGALRGAGNGEGKAAVIAVYSPSGGIGKTTLASHLCQAAGVRGLRVFYLNLEPWNATSLWFGDEGRDDFSRMLYTLQSQPDKAAARMTELRRRHPTLKLDYFAPCGNADERFELTSETVRLLLSSIAGSGEYDLVVADLDSGFDPVHYEVLQSSDYPVWMVGAGPVFRRKTEMALQYGKQKWGKTFGELGRRLRFVLAGGDISGDHYDETLKIRYEAAVPFVEQWRHALEPFGANGSAAYRGAVESLLGKFSIIAREG